MKQILILLTILYILLSVQGCAERVDGSEYDKWQWMAGEMYLSNPTNQVCRHRCALIAKEMMAENVSFDLVFGEAPWAKKDKHVRIEYWRGDEMIILEPMWADVRTSKFIEEDRWMYVPGDEANIRVISWVNRVLWELGIKP